MAVRIYAKPRARSTVTACRTSRTPRITTVRAQQGAADRKSCRLGHHGRTVRARPHALLVGAADDVDAGLPHGKPERGPPVASGLGGDSAPSRRTRGYDPGSLWLPNAFSTDAKN